MSILNQLPGLQTPERWKQVLAALYYLLIVLVLLVGLSGGAKGGVHGVLYAVWLLLLLVLVTQRARLSLIVGATMGQKILGWVLALGFWLAVGSGLASVMKGGPFDVGADTQPRLAVSEQSSEQGPAETQSAPSGEAEAGAQAGGAPAEPSRVTEQPTVPEPPTEVPDATATPKLATRDSPIPLDKSYVVSGKNEEWQLSLGMARVLTGEEANSFLKKVNMFNDDPSPGNQYVLFYPVAAVEGDKVPRELTRYDADDWTVVAAGRPFQPPLFSMIVMPEPEFEGEILPPGELGGWVLVEVPITDDLLAVFRRGKQPYGDWWFALK